MRREGFGFVFEEGFVVLRRAFDFAFEEVGFEEEEDGLCFFVGGEAREGSFRFLEGCMEFDILL